MVSRSFPLTLLVGQEIGPVLENKLADLLFPAKVLLVRVRVHEIVQHQMHQNDPNT